MIQEDPTAAPAPEPKPLLGEYSVSLQWHDDAGRVCTVVYIVKSHDVATALNNAIGRTTWHPSRIIGAAITLRRMIVP